jgi:hypothetical protein
MPAPAILSVTLFRCQTWSHTAKEQQRMKVHEILKGTIRHEMEKELTGWRKVHNEKLHNLYSSHIISMIK